MHRVAISSTGIYIPPYTISNEELVQSFNKYVELFNQNNQAVIAAGEIAALSPSSVEFIQKASGIERRYVIEKSGVLDPTRMRPRLQARPDTEISLMAEIAVKAAQEAMEKAGKTPADIDMVICSIAIAG